MINNNTDRQRFYRLPLPSLPEDEMWRQQRLQKFTQDWDNVPTLANFFGENKTLAECVPLQRYEAIGYMFYEQLQSLFCDDVQDVYQLSAITLGEALVAHLGFTWCRSTTYPNEPLQVYHEPTITLLHLPAWISNAVNRDHLDILDEIFIDILFKFAWNYREYHWLLYCIDNNWTIEQQLAKFKVCPPVALRRKLRLMSWLDDEALLYRLGVQGFLLETFRYGNDPIEKTWEQVTYNLESYFRELHGENWEEQALSIAREHGNEPYLDD